MKNAKKWLTLLSAALLTIFITACASSEDTDQSTGNEEQSSVANEEQSDANTENNANTDDTEAPAEEEAPTDEVGEGQAGQQTEKNSQSGQSKVIENNSNEEYFKDDENLKAEIESDKGIEEARLQVVEKESRVNIVITINADQEQSADQVISTYGETIKQKYPDYTVSIIVVQDGTQLAQKTLK